VDASVAAAWVIPEAHSEAALELAESWLSEGVLMIVPGLFAAEIANALYQRVRRGEMSVDLGHAALHTIACFDIELREEAGLPARALQLAARHVRRSSYDCYYLALAESLGCDYWTADERFYNAVRGSEKRVRFVGAPGSRRRARR
jgi:predicted nucleic acid-binding protein